MTWQVVTLVLGLASLAVSGGVGFLWASTRGLRAQHERELGAFREKLGVLEAGTNEGFKQVAQQIAETQGAIAMRGATSSPRRVG